LIAGGRWKEQQTKRSRRYNDQKRFLRSSRSKLENFALGSSINCKSWLIRTAIPIFTHAPRRRPAVFVQHVIDTTTSYLTTLTGGIDHSQEGKGLNHRHIIGVI
jgi:hypothetical protein